MEKLVSNTRRSMSKKRKRRAKMEAFAAVLVWSFGMNFNSSFV